MDKLTKEEEQELIKYAKVLSAEAVEHKGNGHPGTAVSLAPVAWTIYQRIMKFNPLNPNWLGRDRFILSIGHSSLTQYLQLFYAGFGLTIDDLKKYRTFHSLTPGHPEYKVTPGVEMSTGPLGQGFASSVGFAFGQRFQHGLLSPKTPLGESIWDHNIFVLCGEGDLEEGITSEASSLAGLQKLGNLIVIYDDNEISIEDDVKIAFKEDVLKRYESYGWDVHSIDWTNGSTNPEDYVEDIDLLEDTIKKAIAVKDKPSLINLRTLMAWPTPNKTNLGAAHGSPLGADNIKELKKILGLPDSEEFTYPEALVKKAQDIKIAQGQILEDDWNERFNSWKERYPENFEIFDRISNHKLPEDLENSLPVFEPTSKTEKSIATRVASNDIINSISHHLPEFWGGSADLGSSNGTTIKNAFSFIPSDGQTKAWEGNDFGKVIHFGIREHAMGAILNGIQLNSFTRSFGGTFLVFSDYMRGATRLSALMGINPIYIWSHDSIAVGEDGPTHQPIEHLATLRAIPNFDVVRPADANELSKAYFKILNNFDHPVGLILSRQNLPVYDRNENGFKSLDDVAKGAYILYGDDNPQLQIIATGGEVKLAVESAQELQKQNIKVQVISAPCLEWFDLQSDDYKSKVIDPKLPKIFIEAGIAMPWYKYANEKSYIFSIEDFGYSAKETELYQHFGFTASNVVNKAQELLAL